MANGRGSRTRIDKGRDPGRFIGLPVSVLESAAYLCLSANARSLLLEVALQCKGDDNGRMLLSRAHLKMRGWTSSDMINKGKRELLDAELIFETVKGHRPNKASWYAVTWRSLDKLKGFDDGVEKAFERGAYKRCIPRRDTTKIRGYGKKNAVTPLPINRAVLSPYNGTARVRAAPAHGTKMSLPVPLHGPIAALTGGASTPSHGHPLEKPSAGAGVGVGAGVHLGVEHAKVDGT